VLRKTAVIRNANMNTLRRTSPLQQPLSLHQDPKPWVQLVGYSSNEFEFKFELELDFEFNFIL